MTRSHSKRDNYTLAVLVFLVVFRFGKRERFLVGQLLSTEPILVRVGTPGRFEVVVIGGGRHSVDFLCCCRFRGERRWMCGGRRGNAIVVVRVVVVLGGRGRAKSFSLRHFLPRSPVVV